MIRILVPTALAFLAVFLFGDGAGLAPSTQFMLVGLIAVAGLVATVIALVRAPRSIGRWLLALALAVIVLAATGATILDLSGLE